MAAGDELLELSSLFLAASAQGCSVGNFFSPSLILSPAKSAAGTVGVRLPKHEDDSRSIAYGYQH